MKLLIVRHGDPDYSIDSLTPAGWKEAELLSHRLCKLDVRAFYVSPLGRAKDTASFTLQKLGAEAKVCDWLQEFSTDVIQPGKEHPGSTWDWLPEVWTKEPGFYTMDQWASSGAFAASNAAKQARWVWSELDGLLQEHGYVRDGNCYRVERANEDTIVLFCHFGLECVLLSHLLQISPMLLWHGTCAAPTSVTTLTTEERRKGVAYFRMNAFGDTSHLYVADQKPAFAARFCETYDRADQRHD